MPVMDRTVEDKQENIEWRDRNGISKGPQDGNQTQVAASCVICWRTNHKAIGADMVS